MVEQKRIFLSKTDTEKAEKIVALGWPEVEPYLSMMVVWCEDCNDMVCSVFRPYLISLGDKATPYIRNHLRELTDGQHYYEIRGILIGLISELSNENLVSYEKELTIISAFADERALKDECPQLAQELLCRLKNYLKTAE